MQHPLHTKILSLATPLAQALNLEIWGLEMTGSSHLLLRLYVERSSKSDAPDRSVHGESVPGESVDASASDALTDTDILVGDQRVNIDECAQLSRDLGFLLETEDLIPTAYTLEVSSPGLERIFFAAEQMSPYVGQRLSLNFIKVRPEYPGRKSFVGTIKPLAQEQDKDSFNFLPDDGPEPGTSPILLVVPWSEVKKAHLIYDFEAGKGKKRSQKD